ncbi:MAG TPA: chorismate mutase [Rhodocyclaceae bacterium]|nr:chorismate mutase [Rhodocyclaceae bacterium]
MTELEALRQEIDAIDARIVALIGERFACTDKVGYLKSAHQLPAVDAAREARQMARFETLAREQAIKPELVQRLFRLIVDEVVDKHKKLGAAD